MPGPKSAFRGRLFKAVHAEAAKRKLDHDALHDLFVRAYNVRSMSEATDQQLEGLYRQWTGKTLRRQASLPRRGEASRTATPTMITGEELMVLDQEFSRLGMTPDGRRSFIRRQLRGRETIRTRADYAKVFNGVRAINRREAA